MDDFVHVESPIEDKDPIDEEIPKGNDDLDGTSSPSKEIYKHLSNTDTPLDFLNTHPFVRATVLDKIRGCIIGSALGDAIGLYTEFLPATACASVYPSRNFSLVAPVSEYYADSHRLRFEPCAWTDDTDQALLILLSYIQNASNIDHLPQDFALRLQIWVEQGLRALNRPPCGIGALVGSVVTSPSYLNDPSATAIAAWIKSSRNAAPNGSLMRTHPIGLLGLTLTEPQTWALATKVSQTTHADPRCTVSVCIVVSLIRGLLLGSILSPSDLDAAIERAYQHVLTTDSLLDPTLPDVTHVEITPSDMAQRLDREEFDRYVYASSFSALELDDRQKMGYVYKCLGSAILCLRQAMWEVEATRMPSRTLFEGFVTSLIMEGGDADTNGAVAGALLGAFLGHGYLPEKWATGLAHRAWLDAKILRFCGKLGVVELDGEMPHMGDEDPDGGKGLMDKAELEERDRAMLMAILERKRLHGEKARREGNNRGIASWFSK